MTVRSFAQNFEDVLLWRALKHVRDGRYIDVGAGHPEHHNVTRLFYDAGWSGINIEPLPELAGELARQRPRDLTVQAAVTGSGQDTVELTVVDVWDELSTISEARRAELVKEGRQVTTLSVPSVRLDDVVAEHGGGGFHFLKIDVEGAELEVLHTLDLTRTRPWIVVLEVLSAGQESPDGAAPRTFLEGRDYTYAYFDGLNEFYVAREHAAELLPHFSVPVNVTDDFTAVGESDQVVVELLGGKLGLASPVDPSEVVQRVDALLKDRIDFETRLIEVEATQAAGAAGPGALTTEEHELVRALRLRCEALEQTSFERERLVAWYAAEVARHRATAHRAAVDASALREAADGTREQLAGVLTSTSWRATLPIRMARRPSTYARKLMGR